MHKMTSLKTKAGTTVYIVIWLTLTVMYRNVDINFSMGIIAIIKTCLSAPLMKSDCGYLK